jgi:uncharacterized protein (UPF0248 family)
MIYNQSTQNTAVVRKGQLDEIFSRALHADNVALYFVSYRDFNTIVEVPLSEFMQLSENFQVIPQHRIIRVRRGEQILYHKRGF